MPISIRRGAHLVAAVTLALVTAATSTATAEPTEAPTDPPAASSGLRLELLQPDPAQADAYAQAGIDQVTLELGWDAFEPAPGVLNTTYLDQRLAEARTYQAAGIQVVLDLGLQYPPPWVWDLPGGTRFVNQFGDTWHGGVGTDALNAVWNTSARDAQARAIHLLARYTRDVTFAAVRVGGLLSGELRLPPSTYNGHNGSLWGFDASAANSSPLPHYRPGIGTRAQARTWITWYLASLTNYETWLTRTVHRAFPSADLGVLLPGWGLRPGDVNSSINANLTQQSVAALGDSLSSAVDWARQVNALGRSGLPVVLTTTWLDAPSYGTSTSDQAPVEYLVQLAKPWSLPVTGENTGGGGAAALQRTFAQATRLGLQQVTWMPAATLHTGPVTLTDLTTAADYVG